MKIDIKNIAFFLAFCFFLTPAIQGQKAPAAALNRGALDLAVTYSAARTQTEAQNGFWLQGGSVQVHGQFWKGLGVAAEVAGEHTANMHGSGVGLDLVTATFGPRYTYQLPHRPWQIYAEALGGEANGMHSVFTARTGATDAANSVALNLGGGINLQLKNRRYAVRVLEASWLRTQLPNSTSNTQSHLRLGAGMILHF